MSRRLIIWGGWDFFASLFLNESVKETSMSVGEEGAAGTRALVRDKSVYDPLIMKKFV